MSKLQLTQQYIERKVNFNDQHEVCKFVDRNFYGDLDKIEISREDALWLYRKVKGFIFLDDLAPRVLIKSNYSIYELFKEELLIDILFQADTGEIRKLAVESPNFFKVSAEELTEILKHFERPYAADIATRLITSMKGYLVKKFNAPKRNAAIDSYVEFIDKYFPILIEYAAKAKDFEKEKYFSAYVPAYYIKDYIDEHSYSNNTCRIATERMARHITSVKIFPLKHVLDFIIPYYTTRVIQVSRRQKPTPLIPFSELIKILETHAEDLARNITPGYRQKAYNLLVKPLMEEPGLLRTVRSNISSNEFGTTFTTIASCVTPVSELDRLADLLSRELGTDGLFNGHNYYIRKIAYTRERHDLPVTKEFIMTQIKNMAISDICFNNDCINDFSFWEEFKIVGKLSKTIPDGLYYNSSFKRRFVPKVEELEKYAALPSCEINHTSFARAKFLDSAFVEMLGSDVSLRELSTETLKHLSEGVVEKHLERNPLNRLPGILLENDNLSNEFILEHSERFHDPYVSGFASDTRKLAELVELLG